MISIVSQSHDVLACCCDSHAVYLMHCLINYLHQGEERYVFSAVCWFVIWIISYEFSWNSTRDD